MVQTIPLWLDCDPGHDDTFAILLAAHHPQLNLLGVSTVYGNASLKCTTWNACSILTAIGRSDISTYQGAEKPFCRAAVHAPDIHGTKFFSTSSFPPVLTTQAGITGLDGTELLPEPQTQPISDVPAVLAIRDALLKQKPGTAWVVATGALTNVALLFASFPELVDHIKGLSIMGGAAGGGFTDAPLGTVEGEGERFGNTTPFAEFNIYCDPESAASIFSNPPLARKTTLIPLDLTHSVLATPDIQSRLLHKDSGTYPTTIRQLLHDLLTFFASTYAKVFNIAAGPPLHDPIAVAVLLDPTLGERGTCGTYFDSREEGERFSVDVITDRGHVEAATDGRHRGETPEGGVGTVTGEKRKREVGEVGRTLVNLLHGVSRERGGIIVPRAVDVDWFWKQLLYAVEIAETAAEKPGNTPGDTPGKAPS